MTVYHALLIYRDSTCRFQPFAYDLLGTVRSLNARGILQFLLRSRLTEKGCRRLCERLNRKIKR